MTIAYEGDFSNVPAFSATSLGISPEALRAMGSANGPYDATLKTRRNVSQAHAETHEAPAAGSFSQETSAVPAPTYGAAEVGDMRSDETAGQKSDFGTAERTDSHGDEQKDESGSKLRGARDLGQRAWQGAGDTIGARPKAMRPTEWTPRNKRIGTVATVVAAVVASGYIGSTHSGNGSGESKSASVATETVAYDLVDKNLHGIDDGSGEAVEINFTSAVPVTVNGKSVDVLGKKKVSQLVGAAEKDGKIYFTANSSELTGDRKTPDAITKNVAVIDLETAQKAEVAAQQTGKDNHAFQLRDLPGTRMHPITLTEAGNFEYTDNHHRVGELDPLDANAFKTEQDHNKTVDASR